MPRLRLLAQHMIQILLCFSEPNNWVGKVLKSSWLKQIGASVVPEKNAEYLPQVFLKFSFKSISYHFKCFLEIICVHSRLIGHDLLSNLHQLFITTVCLNMWILLMLQRSLASRGWSSWRIMCKMNLLEMRRYFLQTMRSWRTKCQLSNPVAQCSLLYLHSFFYSRAWYHNLLFIAWTCPQTECRLSYHHVCPFHPFCT